MRRSSPMPAESRRPRLTRAVRWGTVAAVPVLSLAAMQVTDEVAWTGADFLAAFVLLGGVALAYELVLRCTGDLAYRRIAGAALLALVGLLWAHGAINLFG